MNGFKKDVDEHKIDLLLLLLFFSRPSVDAYVADFNWEDDGGDVYLQTLDEEETFPKYKIKVD